MEYNSVLVSAFGKDSGPETWSEGRAYTTVTYDAKIAICVKYHPRVFWPVAIVYILREVGCFLKSVHILLWYTSTRRE